MRRNTLKFQMLLLSLKMLVIAYNVKANARRKKAGPTATARNINRN